MQVMYHQLAKYYNAILKFSSVNTPLEVKTLNKIFKEYRVKAVLDVACGVGRHSIPLSKLGYSVTGIDYSPYQIKEAKKEAKKKNSNAKFLVKDANRFNLPQKFDAALCMWSTIGEEPIQYPRVIKNVYKTLKPKGIFIIDNKNWDTVPRKTKIRNDVFETKDFVLKRKMWDRYTKNFRVRQAILVVNSKKLEEICITHMLSTKQWVKELKKGGFKKFEIYNDYQKKPIKKPKRVLIVAQK